MTVVLPSVPARCRPGTNHLMNEWTNEWMNEWKAECLCVCCDVLVEISATRWRTAKWNSRTSSCAACVVSRASTRRSSSHLHLRRPAVSLIPPAIHTASSTPGPGSDTWWTWNRAPTWLPPSCTSSWPWPGTRCRSSIGDSSSSSFGARSTTTCRASWPCHRLEPAAPSRASSPCWRPASPDEFPRPRDCWRRISGTLEPLSQSLISISILMAFSSYTLNFPTQLLCSSLTT